MKKISKLISLMALSILAVTSCDLFTIGEEYDNYVPAEKPAVAEVYFANNLPSSYDLKGKESFTVQVNRVNTGSALSVSLISGSDKAFTIPATVDFAAGESVANVVITFNPEDLVDGTVYKFDFSIPNETSVYGNSTYSCTASIPAAWVKWKKGHVTEQFWGEEEDENMYIQELSADLSYCYIENCFDTEGGAEPTNYYFYWDKKTNKLSVPMQYMGWVSDSGYDVYFGDAEAFHKDYYGGDEFFIERGYKGAADYAYTTGGYEQPYYDGNGGFYLADFFYYAAADYPGYGFQWGGDKDYFIAEGFDRTTDYNNGFDYTALWTADVNSAIYDLEWSDQPMRLHYDEDKPIDKEDEDKAIYYLSDYFTSGYGLPFIAHNPAVLELEGESIYALDNPVPTGEVVFGQEVYADVKGGKVIFEEGFDYPTYQVNVNIFTKDEDGNKLTNFGTFTEVINPTGILKEWYTPEDLYGLNKYDYYGSLEVHGDDYFEGTSVYWYFDIKDGGTDANKVSWLIFEGFAPYNSTAIPNNTFKVEWYPGDGMLYLGMATFNGPFVYQGGEYPLNIYPASTKTGQYYYDGDHYLLGGYYPDEDNDQDLLVFVNEPYNADEVDGVFFEVEGLGGLAMFSNIYGIWMYDTQSVRTRQAGWSVMKQGPKRLSGISKSGDAKPGKASIRSTASPAHATNSVKKANKTIDTSNAVSFKSEKDFSEKQFNK